MTLTVLLLSTTIGAPVLSPVGTASATHECDAVEQTVTFALGNLGQFADLTFRDGHCTRSHRAGAIDELQEADAKQEKMDIYNAALQQQAESDVQTTVTNNYLNDTQSVAWMKAEIAIAEAYKNGSSKEEAQAEAKEAIQEYYAVKQRNMIENWQVSVVSYRTLHETASSEENITQDPLERSKSAAAPVNQGYYSTDSYVAFTGSPNVDSYASVLVMSDFTNRSVTLVNGSTEQARAIEFAYYDGQNSEIDGTRYMTIDEGQVSKNDATARKLVVEPPNDTYDRAVYMDPDDYAKSWERVETLNDDLQSEVDPFVNETWDAYESGQINSSDVLSRNTQMFEYGVDATNDSSRNLYNVVAALSSMGLDTPSIAGAGTMEVRYAGETYNGLVMAREAPNGSWTAGETYNTSEIPGVVMLATTEGEQINMEGEFTIQAINAEDGTTVKHVNATKTVYKTSNTTELLNKMDEISSLRAQVEAYEARLEAKGAGGGTSGGDGGSGLLESLAAFLGISAGAAAVVLVGVAVVVYRVYTP